MSRSVTACESSCVTVHEISNNKVIIKQTQIMKTLQIFFMLFFKIDIFVHVIAILLCFEYNKLNLLYQETD